MYKNLDLAKADKLRFSEALAEPQDSPELTRNHVEKEI